MDFSRYECNCQSTTLLLASKERATTIAVAIVGRKIEIKNRRVQVKLLLFLALKGNSDMCTFTIRYRNSWKSENYRKSNREKEAIHKGPKQRQQIKQKG